MRKKKTNRNPILPRSKSDPIGMGRNVRKMFSDIEGRYYKIKLDIKNLLDRKVIPRSITGVNEKARTQPTVWVRLQFGSVKLVGNMVITALSSEAPTNDLVTFSAEFKVADASSVAITTS